MEKEFLHRLKPVLLRAEFFADVIRRAAADQRHGGRHMMKAHHHACDDGADASELHDLSNKLLA